MKLAPYVHVYLEDVDGKEAVTEALQYLTKLVMVAVPEDRAKLRRLYDSFSQARKVFRLFRFIPELLQATDPEPKDDSFLKRTKHFTAACFFLVDHYLLLLQTFIPADRKHVLLVKSFKNRISLLYSMVGLLVDATEALSSIADTLDSRHQPQIMRLKLIKSIVKALHHTFRLWLTSHKLEMTLIGKPESWSEQKSGLLGFATAILDLTKRGLTVKLNYSL